MYGELLEGGRGAGGRLRTLRPHAGAARGDRRGEGAGAHKLLEAATNERTCKRCDQKYDQRYNNDQTACVYYANEHERHVRRGLGQRLLVRLERGLRPPGQ